MSLQPITDSQTLSRFCRALSAKPYVTVDTEFIREKTYWPQLCLVQVAAPTDEDGTRHEGIVDVLAAGLDLDPLYELMANRAILKVFHAARQDLEIFYYRMGEVPAPVFDTQVAAMVCGHGDQIGYEAIVRKLLRQDVDKASRFTDWAARPLSERQLTYALSDVTHLLAVYEKIAKELERNGRAHWLEEEMAILTSATTYRNEPQDAWRRLKTRNLKPRFLSILKSAASWREREAQERDIPRNRIVKDDTLLEVAASAPKSERELDRIRGLSNGFVHGKMGRGLLAAVADGLSVPAKEAPRNERPLTQPGLGAITDLLKVLLKYRCEEAGVATRLVATAEELELLAADDEADVPALRGWRRELFGTEALDLKHGRIALAARGRRVCPIRLDRTEKLVSSADAEGPAYQETSA